MTTLAIAAPPLPIEKKRWDPKTEPKINALFRCDKCSAQAYVEIRMAESGLPLYFCVHHSKTYEKQLDGLYTDWYTEEDRLIENRKQGSEN